MTEGRTRLLRSDRRGIAALEFALLAMPLFLLIMAGIEYGFMMYVRARLGGVLQQAARMATTGDTDTNGANGEKIDAMVQTALAFTRSTKVTVYKSYYDSFDQVHRPEVKNTSGTTPPYCWTDVNGNQIWDADPSRSGLGGANDIINYKVAVSYRPLFPLIAKAVMTSPTVNLSGQATLQNEPFAGGQDQQEKQCCISAAVGNPVTCTAT